MDSPWDEEAGPDTLRDTEWSKMSSEFTTTGYREGITAGKEAAVQEGFDTGFATIGTPIGREIGMLRGMVSALLASINGNENSLGGEFMLTEARSISSQLSKIRFSEVAPRDLEAEAHAREHFEMDEEDAWMEESGELVEKRQMESLEDMLTRLNSGVDTNPTDQYKKFTLEDVLVLRQRILSLCTMIGIRLVDQN
ncbi:hypothetical protein EV368DRAFT_69488 [Lentinula lateritia]|uniref:Uncharacterized protein n=1 Tax=Lentinula aff. lateritia TaxID=2804960 RepID=A0ACC1TLQ1_9AGAR|nr:hypothetical protein F5876DRAFT_51856 [Lentinula aff. lateritia]KAJ3846964.1 hypothetical protein EV368DRAFT_69488 [Lentinula lateritia]